MARLSWGNSRSIGLRFASNYEYYFTLGFLCNKRQQIVVYTHNNEVSGAWGGQGKLERPKYSSISSFPPALLRAFAASGDDRLSVSDYVENLVRVHAFDGFRDPTGNRYTFYRFPTSIERVRSTVPAEYKSEFERGFTAS